MPRVRLFILLFLLLAGCSGGGPAASARVNFPAPGIEGTDAEGKHFKLSDYRGKVVLLDFWAGWCGPCMLLVPHERFLVKNMEGRPFVLLGVNADQSEAELRAAEQKHRINWRSWWDGGNGTIQRQWKVGVLPTLFLIDHEGIVRYRFAGLTPNTESELDAALLELLKKVPPQ
jgi:thiol-disulfide isomerase/thioredoxin